MNRWNADLYDGKHSFVSEFGKDLIEVLAPRRGELILDLGCGTGDLTRLISQTGADVIGVDNSAEMVRRAREKYPQLCCMVADARSLDYADQFDAVFSNSVLHWIKPPEAVLKCIWSALRPGGRFVAEFGGKGNVRAILSAIIDAACNQGIAAKSIHIPWFFPSIGQYAKLMEEAGFAVAYAAHFDRPTRLEGEDGLRNWLSMFGGSLLADLPAEMHEVIIRKAENSLSADLYCDGVWTADYSRIRVVGNKPRQHVCGIT